MPQYFRRKTGDRCVRSQASVYDGMLYRLHQSRPYLLPGGCIPSGTAPPGYHKCHEYAAGLVSRTIDSPSSRRSLFGNTGPTDPFVFGDRKGRPDRRDRSGRDDISWAGRHLLHHIHFREYRTSQRCRDPVPVSLPLYRMGRCSGNHCTAKGRKAFPESGAFFL